MNPIRAVRGVRAVRGAGRNKKRLSRWERILRKRGRATAILSSSGLILAIAGFIFFTPLVLLLFGVPEAQYAGAFIVPGVVLVAGGLLLRLSLRSTEVVSVSDGSVILLVSWIAVCVATAYTINRITGLGFTRSMFEAVSGWTTTGLSVVDVDQAPRILLLWRSIIQLGGGAGLAIIMLAMFSLPVGAGLYRAEGKGDQLVPNVVASAKIVLLLYAGYALIGVVAYAAAGMSLFDAINHSFAAVSTGGFSTRSQSIGYWNSPQIEAVSIVLMILGNFNFATAFLLVRGKARAFLRNGELRLFVLLLAIAIPVVLLVVTRGLYPTLGKSVRVAVFETVSALTTTGFSTVSYNNWNGTGFVVMLTLMIIGGGTCSTAGGIKQYRIYLLAKSIFWDIRRSLSPRHVIERRNIWQGEYETHIDDQQIRQAGTFVLLYLAILAFGIGMFTAYGYPLRDAAFEFASTLGTVGLSIGITGPKLPDPLLWTQIVGMFLGRLEFFVVFAGIGRLVVDVKEIALAR